MSKRSCRARAFLAIVLGAAVAAASAQVTEIGGIGNIFSKRKAGSTPEAKSARATPTPGPKGSPPSGQPAPATKPTPPGGARPPHQGAGTATPPPQQGGRPAPRPGQASNAPAAATGQLRVATKQLAESVKTRLVEYDEEALRTSGTAIILSPRKFKAATDRGPVGFADPERPRTND